MAARLLAQTVSLPTASFAASKEGADQRKSFSGRFVVLGEEKARSSKVCERARATSGIERGAVSCDVLDCAYGRCKLHFLDCDNRCTDYLQELAVWRKQATISVQEEFTGKALPPTLEDSLPQNLQETFDTVRSGVKRSADLYINLCSLTERLSKRKEAIASEYGRFSQGLTNLTETSFDTYAIDPNDVPLLNDGMKNTAKHLGTAQALDDDEARAWDEGLLEDLKTMRDSLVSMRDMFDRRDRLARDNIPQLEKKIQQNESKLQGIKAKGDQAKAGEEGKVADAIVKVSSDTCVKDLLEQGADLYASNPGQAKHSRSTRAGHLHQRMHPR